MNDELSFGSFGDFSSNTNEGTVKLPVCLVLDKSGSMQEKTFGRTTKIDELNRNVVEFINYIRNDTKARRLCDLCIVAFGGEAPEIVQGYTAIDKVNFIPLQAGGRTPMGGAVQLAIGLLEKRRTWYRNEGIQHYKPIMMLMSDGIPTDEYQSAAIQMTSMVKNKQIKIFPVGIGADFQPGVQGFQILSSFSPDLPPKRITDVQGFMTLFQLLSKSTSNPQDDSIDKWFKETI